MAQVIVKYFGIAQDIAQTSEQKIEAINSLQDLIQQLYQAYPALNNPKIKIAHNLQIIPQQDINSIKLSDGDEIVFLPPFAGG